MPKWEVPLTYTQSGSVIVEAPTKHDVPATFEALYFETIAGNADGEVSWKMDGEPEPYQG